MSSEEQQRLIVSVYPTLRRIVKGRVHKLYLQARRDWIAQNPPPIDGRWYVCGVCEYFVHKQKMTIDHIVMQCDAPELELTLSNFQPAHPECNVLRGRLMTDPEFLIQMRSKPSGSHDREIADRVIRQAQELYAAWHLQTEQAHD